MKNKSKLKSSLKKSLQVLGPGLITGASDDDPSGIATYSRRVPKMYGLTAPVLITLILHICNNKKIMGGYTNNKKANILGIITLVLMTSAAVIFLYLQFFIDLHS